MKINSLHLVSFGKFKNQSFDLDKDLNLFYGLNEAGKTTIIHFIEGMIYGFYDPFRKGRYRLDIYDRYLPEDGAYIGHMVLTHQKKKYRLERNFSAHTFTIYHPDTGEDLTDQFPFDSDLKQASISKFLKLPYPLFLNTIRMVQTDLDTKKTAEHILFKRLSNLNKTKTTTFSGEGALKYLKDKKDLIGSKSAPTKPYAKALKKKETLTEEKKRLDDYVKQLKNIQHEQTLTDQKYEALLPELEALRKEKDEIYLKQTASNIFTLKTEFEKTNKISFETMLNEIESLVQSTFLSDLKTVQNTTIESEKPLDKPGPLIDQETLDKALKTLDEIKALKNQNQQTIILDQIKMLEEEKASLAFKEIPVKPKLSFKALLIFPLIKYLVDLIKYKKALKAFNNESTYAFQRNAKIDALLNDLYIQKREEENNQKGRLEKIKTLEASLLFTGDDAKTTYQILYRENLNYKEALKIQDESHQKLETIHQRYQPLYDALKLENPSLETVYDMYRLSQKTKDILGSFSLEEVSVYMGVPLKEAPFDETVLKDLEQKEKHYLKEQSRLESERLRVLDVLSDYEKVIAERDEASAQIEEYEATLKQIKKAEKLLSRSIDIIEENFAPALSEAINHRLKAVTLKKYQSIKIRKDLSFKIETPNGLKPLSYFSTGTLDQIYFAIRLGILDVLDLSKFPLLLDDAFMHYDIKRLEAMLQLVSQLDRQIILLTAHEREETGLKRLKIPYERIDLNG